MRLPIDVLYAPSCVPCNSLDESRCNIITERLIVSTNILECKALPEMIIMSVQSLQMTGCRKDSRCTGTQIDGHARVKESA